MVDGQPTEVLKTYEAFALLSTAPMSRPPLDLRKNRVPVGEAVVSFGYGYGWMQVLQRHIASWKAGDIIMDGALVPGMSGGPVVDLKGRVVGLNQGTDQNGGLSTACGTDEMRAFLKSVPVR